MGWFLEKPVKRGMSLEDTVDAIHDQGGLVIIPHPFMPVYFGSIQPYMLRRLIEHHPVDGILLVPADSRDSYLKAIAAGATPLVAIDRPIEVATTDSVEVENRAGARMAVEHLTKRWDFAGEHRGPTCQRLDRRQAEPLVVAREHQRVRAAVDRRKLVVGHLSGQQHVGQLARPRAGHPH